MKNFLILFISIFFLILTLRASYACDPLNCLMTGENGQDTLILGEIETYNDGVYLVRVNYIFPQTEDKLAKEINVDASIELNIGSKYLFSLKKDGKKYVTLWGAYEVKGDKPEDTKLTQYASLDDIAIELFIQSKGKKTNYGFDYSVKNDGNYGRLLQDGQIVATSKKDPNTNVESFYLGDKKVGEYTPPVEIYRYLIPGVIGVVIVVVTVVVIKQLQPKKRKRN